jgi:hypothetical protein
MTIELDHEGPLFEQLARDLKRSILGGALLAIVPEKNKRPTIRKSALQPPAARPRLHSNRRRRQHSIGPKGIRTPPLARNPFSPVEFDDLSLCRALVGENQPTAERIFRTGNLLFFFSKLQTRPKRPKLKWRPQIEKVRTNF